MNASEILKTYFGYDSFRNGQKEIIASILEGRDALAIMPTGAGKSVCYQVPALLLSGITLVISPLISLMQDQVHALNEAGIHAAFINSSLTETQISKVLDLARKAHTRFCMWRLKDWKVQDLYNLRSIRRFQWLRLMKRTVSHNGDRISDQAI